MVVKLELVSFRSTTWTEYITRFVFGGTITLLAGLIADKFGAAIGGLFLAFPAIFPASASLIAKHEQAKKRRTGRNGEVRGALAAALDAAGTAMGCLGLAGFAAVAWTLLPRLALWETLVFATGIWVVAAIAAWIVRRHFL